jgi:hypothetical protein
MTRRIRVERIMVYVRARTRILTELWGKHIEWNWRYLMSSVIITKRIGDDLLARTLFPYAEDRITIERYVTGQKSDWPSETTRYYDGVLAITDGNLRSGDGGTILHYDTAGALIATIPSESMIPTVVRVLNYALECVGSGERIEREPDNVHENVRWTYNGGYIRPGDPFVLVGVLGMQALKAVAASRSV